MDSEAVIYSAVIAMARRGESPPERLDPHALLEAVGGDPLLAIDAAVSFVRARNAVLPRFMRANRALLAAGG